MNNSFNNNQEIIDKLKNYFKKLTKEKYYDAIFPTIENLEDFKALVNWTENRISDVQKNPDSKKRFDLSVNFLKNYKKKNSTILKFINYTKMIMSIQNKYRLQLSYTILRNTRILQI